MVLVSAALLNKTGRALINKSGKMTIMLSCLTSLNNLCFLPRRVRVTASDAVNTVDLNLELVNYTHIRNHSIKKEHVVLGPGTTAVAITILELTHKGETCLQIK